MDFALKKSYTKKNSDLTEYILDTNVYPREPSPMKELRDATESHPFSYMRITAEAGQLLGMLIKLVNAKKTIEIGVYTGYSLLLTALSTTPDGMTIAIDPDRESYEFGLPIIRKACVEHKINFIQSQALPVLDKLLQNKDNEGGFDFAFIDADKENYQNYHERLLKLVKVGGLIVFDNTLWGGTVTKAEEAVPEERKESWRSIVEFNQSIATDQRIEISLVPLGDGMTICRRIY